VETQATNCQEHQAPKQCFCSRYVHLINLRRFNGYMKIQRRRISLNLPLWAYNDIKKLSKDNKISITSIILELLKNKLN